MEFQERCIRGTEADLKRRGLVPDPNRIDETVSLGDAKVLIAQSVQDAHGAGSDAAKDAYRADMNDLQKGRIVYLADKTCIRYNAETRTFRHWL
jgi:hypothetical protein